METEVKVELRQKLLMANKLLDQGEPDLAWKLIEEELERDPNDIPALMAATHVSLKARERALAYQFAARAVMLAPNSGGCWRNFGVAAEQIFRLDEAEKAYRMALSRTPDPDERRVANLNNMSAVFYNKGEYQKAEDYARQALAIDPEYPRSCGNLGGALLGQRKWREGWPNYAKIVGSDVRRLVKYRDEPTWDGTPDARVVIYGEQGIGDELSFASMVPDAIRVCRKVILDCDGRLEGLFRRSFPDTTVYGTRWVKDPVWDAYDMNPQYSITIGQLGQIFRNEDSDFPGTPYLVPDPVRVEMWRHHFKRLGKPVIGIAWSGGLPWTADRFRVWKLEDLQPLFNACDAHWVCLQYKDAAKEIEAFEGAEIHQYPYATLTKDYDDTAAMVAALDLVICMQTSVGHLAAAMGVETWCFVNKLRQWRYGTDDMLWYKAMKLYRQSQSGIWPIADAARVLALRYGVSERRRA